MNTYERQIFLLEDEIDKTKQELIDLQDAFDELHERIERLEFQHQNLRNEE